MNDQVRVEKILVAKTSTTLPADGTKFVNDTNAAIGAYAPGKVMLADGQIGVYSASGSNRNTAVDNFTVAGESKIFIAQGRSTANDRNPLPPRPYEISAVIDRNSRLRFLGATCSTPRNSAVMVGTTAGDIVAQDETLYGLTIAFNGRRTDILNGKTGPAFFPEYTTPDYTALGTSAEDARDDLVQNLVYQINSHSYVWSNPTAIENVVAFAIATPDSGAEDAAILAAAGGVTAPTATNIANGTITDIYLGYDSAGNAVTITNSESIQNTFTDLIANTDLAGADLIVPVAIGAAAAAAAGYAAGDGTVDAEAFIVMAYDDAESLAYIDTIPEHKERIDVGLRQGFNTAAVTVDVGSRPDEGQGQGRKLKLFYDSTDGLRKYQKTHPDLYAPNISYGNDIIETADYNVYAIEHDTDALVSDGTAGTHPHITIILIPCDQTALIQSFEDILVAFGNANRAEFGGILDAEAYAERLVYRPAINLTAGSPYTAVFGEIATYETDGAIEVDLPNGASPGDRFGIQLDYVFGNSLIVDFTGPTDYAGNAYKYYGASANATLTATGLYIYKYVNSTIGWVLDN